MRLGREVKQARRDAGQRHLADWAIEVGVSSKTLGQLEAGRPVSDSTVDAVEQALVRAGTWPRGRARQILDGSVGADLQDSSYVAHSRPDDVPSRVSDDEVLAAIDRMAAELDVLKKRLQRRDDDAGSEPLDGAP